MNTENFEKLPTEKQYAVLNAAFSCFGRDGYKKTAMSEIASEAGVSKAALFHYFGTKKICTCIFTALQAMRFCRRWKAVQRTFSSAFKSVRE